MKRTIAAMAITTLFLFAQSGRAQVARVFLAGSGNDANDCTNIDTPCRSLQAAVNQCPVKGEVIIISSGGFGTAFINKSLTVDTAPGVIAFNARSISVSILSTDTVTLRGLTMNGSIFGDLTGIQFSTAGTLNIENSEIGGFTNYAIFQGGGTGSALRLRNCNIHDSVNGLYVLPNGSGVVSTVVENCQFHNISNVAFWAWARATATIVDSVFTNNATGIAAYSTVSTAKTVVTVDRCMISGSTSYGLVANATGAGIAAIYVSNTAITSNANANSALTGSGGTASIISFGNNSVSNNGFTAAFTSTVPTT